MTIQAACHAAVGERGGSVRPLATMQQSAGRRFPGRLPRSDALVLDAAPVKRRVEGIELDGVAVRETVAVHVERSLDRLVTDSHFGGRRPWPPLAGR
jgi:hypothetical protein